MRIVEPYAKLVSTYPCGTDIIKQIANAARTSHQSKSTGYDSDLALVRRLMNWGHLSVLEHAVLSAEIRTDRGVTHELVRHRLASYVQESTRYVDYSKSGEISVIKPTALKFGSPEYKAWESQCQGAEDTYFAMLDADCEPETARAILPTCLKADIFMTANLREWRTIFALRCDKAAHPDIRHICQNLLNQFQAYVPVIFDDLWFRGDRS